MTFIQTDRSDASGRAPLKLNVSRDWCEKMAELEGDSDVTAGSESAFPSGRAEAPTRQIGDADLQLLAWAVVTAIVFVGWWLIAKLVR